MRKIWKLRKIFLPQAVTVFMLLTATTFAPKSEALVAPNQNNTDNAGTVTTTTYITENSGKEAALTTSVPVSGAARQAASERGAQNAGEFDSSITAALGKMNLSPRHFDEWIRQHPNSTLKQISKMTPQKQRNVANIASFIRSVNKKLPAKTAWREAAAIVHYCGKYGISTKLAVAIAKAESHFNPSAQSRAGACGVMQVMWKVHSGMLRAKGIATVKDHMFDPERGVEAGVLLLSRYVNVYGSVQKALTRYYGGIATKYVKKVNKNMAMLDSHFNKTGF